MPKVTSHIFRKMLSGFMKSQQSIFLDQAEEHMACHGADTRNRFYIDAVTKRLLAVAGNQWFRSKVESQDDLILASSKHVFTNQKQAKRYQKAQEALMRKKLQDVMDLELKANSNFKPSLDKFLSVEMKINGILAIEEGHGFQVTSLGSTLDIFFTDRPVVNKKCASVFLRLICMLNPDVHCTKVLHDSLVLYAGLHAGQDINLRNIEWKWAFKFLESIHWLQRTPHISLKSLMFIFSRILKEHGNKYVQHTSKFLSVLYYSLGTIVEILVSPTNFVTGVPRRMRGKLGIRLLVTYFLHKTTCNSTGLD